jgi:hypothetical protein
MSGESESLLLFAFLERGLDKFRVAKPGNSGNVRIRELIYLAICGLVAIGLYLAWQLSRPVQLSR